MHPVGPDRGRRRVIRRLLPLLLVTALAATACVTSDHSVQLTSNEPDVTTTTALGGSAPGSTTVPSGPATTLAPVNPPPVGRYRLSAWKDCKKGFQCATLQVPLDWEKPNGTKISLAVVRKPATGPGTRIGSVLMNPGGPGEPGVSFLRDFSDAGRLPKGLGDRLDLVAWDPRGTGDSAGIRCVTDEQLQEPDPDPTPSNPAQDAALLTDAAEQLNGCEKNDGAELPFVGTRNTVRDLDALRGALGDAKLTYIGYSYGTTIGTIYAEMFPQHIRAMVLDGVTAVGADPVIDTHDQARSFESNLEAFFANCASRGNCLFGGSNPRQAFLDLVADLETGKRLPGTYSIPDAGGTEHQRKGTVGIGELYSAVIVTLYGKENWTALDQMLQAASNGDGKLALYLRDQLAGRQDDGSWSHIGDANIAINCADQALRPTNALGDPTLRSGWSTELPLLGAIFATGTPGCANFPAAREPLPLTTRQLVAKAPPLVLVGATDDPATPYAQAQALDALLPNAVLVTWESEDHTAYGRGSSCLDDPITKYLEDLTLPREGLRCRP